MLLPLKPCPCKPMQRHLPLMGNFPSLVSVKLHVVYSASIFEVALIISNDFLYITIKHNHCLFYMVLPIGNLKMIIRFSTQPPLKKWPNLPTRLFNSYWANELKNWSNFHNGFQWPYKWIFTSLLYSAILNSSASSAIKNHLRWWPDIRERKL